eukprot:COSAG06_NODE_20652_length_786_cov_1.748180_1_plen_23_part_01
MEAAAERAKAHGICTTRLAFTEQ